MNSNPSSSILAVSTGADNTAFTRMLAELGLSAKTGWFLSFFLYTTEGLVLLIVGWVKPGIFPDGIMTLSGLAVAFGIFSLFGAIHFGDQKAEWTTHMRLAPGLILLTSGIAILGPQGQAFILLPMLTVLTPCFLYGPRFAIPYSLWTLGITTYGLFFVAEGDAQLARNVISTAVIVMTISSFVIAERRTRSLTKLNSRLAYSDPLTGIANTRRLRERITAALERSAEGAPPFALFAMDLDNFKLVNDTFDHSTGDAVLRAVAEEIDGTIESGDLAARRGGDEFSVLVANTEGRDLEALASELERAINRARTRVCPAVTPSGSVAYVHSQPEDTLASVLQRADDHLHDVKRAFHSIHGDRESVLAGIVADKFPLRPAAGVNDPDAASGRSRVFSRATSSLVSRFTGPNLAGAYASTVFLPIGLIVGTMAALGELRPLSPFAGIAINCGFFVLAGLCLALTGRAKTTRLLHAAFTAAMLLISLELVLAGRSGVAFIDVYVVLTLNAYYYFPPRAAMPYLFTCLTLYPAFTLAGGFADPGIRIAVNTMVVLLAAAVIIKIRTVTVRFVRMNRELSEVDALTGVANLRSLRSRVEYSLDTASGGMSRPSIVSVDLDKFKLVNDTYSHTVGDQVIVAVARALSEAVRSDDLVARRGGDEFFILCTGEPHEIRALSARLAEAVVHARMRICPDLLPSGSITSTQWEAGESTDEFLARADTALHDEKTAKRARGYDRATA